MSWHPGTSRVLPHESQFKEGVDVWCDTCETGQEWVTRRDQGDRQEFVQRKLFERGWGLDDEQRDICPACLNLPASQASGQQVGG